MLLHQLCQLDELQAVVHDRDNVVSEVRDLQARERTSEHRLSHGCQMSSRGRPHVDYLAERSVKARSGQVSLSLCLTS
jgi:hypothetical protein